MENSLKDIKVLYHDYLGVEHRGKVVLTQPCNAPDVEAPDEHGQTCYVYIKDELEELNDKEYNGIRYADIRRSDECVLIYTTGDLKL